jgi:prolyl oligopeptidase
MLRRSAALVATLILAFLAAPVLAGGLKYPQTKRIDHLDTYHGVQVPDPYRWLEDDVRASSEVREWVEAQNAVTFAYLEAIPQREGIRQRLTELWNYERFGAPFKAGSRYFVSRNSGLTPTPGRRTARSRWPGFL